MLSPRCLTLCLSLAACSTPAPDARPAPRTTSAPAPPVVAQPAVPSPFSPVTDARLLVVATASVQGYVEPCGCTREPLGGVARLAGLLAQARAAYQERVLFVDAGDLLYEKPTDTAAIDACQHAARTELLVGSYARAGLAATTKGALDVVRGADARDALLAKHQVPSVDDGRGVVVVRGGVRAFVLGLDDHGDVAAANAAIAAARNDVDVVVVLAQLELGAARRAAAALVGADLVVVGKAPEDPQPPERHGQATLVVPGWQAQRASLVDVVLPEVPRADRSAPIATDARAADRDARVRLLDVRLQELDALIPTLEQGHPKTLFQQKRRAQFRSERENLVVATFAPLAPPYATVQALPLRRGMFEDAKVRDDLAAYEAQIPALVAQCEEGAVCDEPAPGTATYVGAATCKVCHARAYAFWQQATVVVERTTKAGAKEAQRSGHALAMATLVAGGRERDRTCVGCHSAGFAEPGGACTTTAITAKGLAGVQCESCHGPGSLHVQGDRARIARDVPESRCRSCHVPPHIERREDFVYDERLLHVLGPGHGEARRATLLPPQSP